MLRAGQSECQYFLTLLHVLQCQLAFRQAGASKIAPGGQLARWRSLGALRKAEGEFRRVLSGLGLDVLLARTDILVCLLPHTPQTEGILCLGLFGKLKADGPLGGPVMINAGRGKLQIEADIVTAIQDGLLKGASLDVFETEPLPASSPLWALPGVILTPHNSANSTPRATTAYLTRQIKLFEDGKPVESLVEKGRGY